MPVCPSCGAVASSSGRFCRQCGAAVGSPAPAVGTPPPSPALPPPGPRSPSPPPPPAAPGSQATRVENRSPPYGPPAAREPAAPAGSPYVPVPSRTSLDRRVLLALGALLLILGAGVAGFAVVRFSSASDEGGDRGAAAGDEGEAAEEPVEAADGSDPFADEQAVAASVQELIVGFHEEIVAGQYDAAWGRLSKRKQAQIEREDGFDAWRDAQASLGQYLDPSGASVEIEELDRSTGEARVRVGGMGWSKPGADCSSWSGITWAKYDNGTWRYDPGYSTTSERESRWRSRYDELLGGAC